MWTVVRQPDQLLAIWSTVVDDFIIVDAEPAEIVQAYIDNYARNATDDAMKAIQTAASNYTELNMLRAEFTGATDE